MHLIQIETIDPAVIEGLCKLSDSNENIDIIQSHSFSGDLTNIELYVKLTAGVIAAITPIITALIKNNKITSLKIDNDKIELNNASSKTTKELIQKYFESKQTTEEAKSEIENDGNE